VHAARTGWCTQRTRSNAHSAHRPVHTAHTDRRTHRTQASAHRPVHTAHRLAHAAHTGGQTVLLTCCFAHKPVHKARTGRRTQRTPTWCTPHRQAGSRNSHKLVHAAHTCWCTQRTRYSRRSPTHVSIHAPVHVQTSNHFPTFLQKQLVGKVALKEQPRGDIAGEASIVARGQNAEAKVCTSVQSYLLVYLL